MPFGLCPGVCLASGAWIVAAFTLFAPPISLDALRGRNGKAPEDDRDVL